MDVDEEPSGFQTAMESTISDQQVTEPSQPFSSTPAPCKTKKVQVHTYNPMDVNHEIMQRLSPVNWMQFADPTRVSPIIGNQGFFHLHDDSSSSSEGEVVSHYFQKGRKRRKSPIKKVPKRNRKTMVANFPPISQKSKNDERQ